MMIAPSEANDADAIVIPVSLTIAIQSPPERRGMSRLRAATIATANGWEGDRPGVDHRKPRP